MLTHKITSITIIFSVFFPFNMHSMFTNGTKVTGQDVITTMKEITKETYKQRETLYNEIIAYTKDQQAKGTFYQNYFTEYQDRIEEESIAHHVYKKCDRLLWKLYGESNKSIKNLHYVVSTTIQEEQTPPFSRIDEHIINEKFFQALIPLYAVFLRYHNNRQHNFQ